MYFGLSYSIVTIVESRTECCIERVYSHVSSVELSADMALPAKSAFYWFMSTV